MGEALRPYAGRVTIATKFGHTYRDGRMVPGVEDCTPASIRRVCEASLKRLGVETIGIFYQHRQDKNVPVEDVAGTVADLIREGKVQRFGLSMVDADTVRRAHAVCPVTAVQSRYSMFSRECETSVFPVLEELGIGFVAYAPLAIGWLAGDLNEFTRFTADNRPRISLFAPAALRANGRVIAALQDFGRERGMTPAQVALAWILAKRPWIVPIPGTTKEGHLLENQLAGDFPLTEADMAELQTLVDAVPVEGLPDFMVRHPA